MSLTIVYNRNNTITVTCGTESVSIGAPGTGSAGLPPPVSTGGDGVVTAFRHEERQEVRVGAGVDPATLLRGLASGTGSEVLLVLPKETSDPLDVGDILRAARTTFGDDVTVFFAREGDDG